MRLYAYDHLHRIGLDTYAYKNLKRIYNAYDSPRADIYFVPTDDFEKMVQQNNIVAALKGVKIVKPVYKNVYNKYQFNKHTDQVVLVWS